MQKQKYFRAAMRLLTCLIAVGVLAWAAPASAQVTWDGAMDIGSVQAPGSSVVDGNQITITASGTDLWNAADGFYFAYKRMVGDGQIIARLNTIEGADGLTPNGWAKVGLMFRETLEPGSKDIICVQTISNNRALQARATTGAGYLGDFGGMNGVAPSWLKLMRKGNSFRAWTSDDGLVWTEFANPASFSTLSVAQTAYVGICATAHTDGNVVGTNAVSIITNLTDISITEGTPPSVLLDPAYSMGLLAPNSGLATKMIQVKNDGSLPLTLSGAAVTGANFTLVGVKVDGVVSSFPVTVIRDGAKVELEVTYNATAEGAFMGQLSVLSNDPDKPSVTVPIGVAVGVDDLPLKDGLVWHLSADVGVIKNGASALGWIDLSPTGNGSAFQADAAKQPAWQDNMMGAQPVLSFDGTDDTMAFLSPASVRDFSTIVVFKVKDGGTANDYRHVFSTDGWQYGAVHYHFSNLMALNVGINGVDLGGDAWFVSNDAAANVIPFDQPFIAGFSEDGREFRSWLNGGSPWVQKNRNGKQTKTLGPGHLGAYNGTGNFTNMELAEVIAYNHDLTYGEQNQVAYYLKQKYGITDEQAPAIKTPPVPYGVVRPLGLDFGCVESGDKVTRTVNIANDGDGQMMAEVHTVNLSGCTIENVKTFDGTAIPSANNYRSMVDGGTTIVVTLAYDGTKPIVATEALLVKWAPADVSFIQEVNVLIGGKAGVALPPVQRGLLAAFAADNITLTTADGTVDKWPDYSPVKNDLNRSNGAPKLQTNVINGKPAVYLSGDTAGDRFTCNENMVRTAFVVCKEDEGTAANWRAILGHTWANDFHRGVNGAIICGPPENYATASTINGETRLNGSVVDSNTTLVPQDKFSLISIRTAGEARFNQLGRDRGMNDRHWFGHFAEVILYDRVLSDAENQQVGLYLQQKYGLTGTFAAPPEGPKMVVSATAANFGSAYADTNPVYRTIKITNGGFGSPALQIYPLALTGTDFTIVGADLNGVALDAPYGAVVRGGDEADELIVKLAFKPNATLGEKTANLTISGNDPANASVTVALKGSVVAKEGAWFSKDIGNVDMARPGSTTVVGEGETAQVTIFAAGQDIWNRYDEFRYVFQELKGDGSIQAQVLDIQPGTGETLNDWVKAGVMIRDNVSHGSTYAMAEVTNNIGVGANSQFRLKPERDCTGGSGQTAANNDGVGAIRNGGYFVRVERVGNLFKTYASMDGDPDISLWTNLGTQTIPMGETVLIGLAVTSHEDDRSVTALFSGVKTEGVVSDVEIAGKTPNRIHVKQGGTGLGTSWDDAMGDVRAAVLKAQLNNSGEVWVAGGNYYMSDTVRVSSIPFLGMNMAIYGGFAGTETELAQRDLNANNLSILFNTAKNSRLFGVYSQEDAGLSNITIDGFVMTGGNVQDSAWEVFEPSGSAIVANNVDYSLAVRNCKFIDNRCGGPEVGGRYGGAIGVVEGGSRGFTVENCTFAGNYSKDFGGAIFVWWTNIKVKNSLFAGNYSGAQGAAIGGLFGHVNRSSDFVNCTFANNQAGADGLTLARYEMGGLYFTNNIIANNKVGNRLFARENATSGAKVRRDADLIFGNTQNDPADDSILQGAADITGDPKFGASIVGSWASVAGVAGTSTTLLTATGDVFGAANSLVGRLINPDTTTQSLQTLIVANTANSVTVLGDLTDTVVAALPFEVFDYTIQTGSAAIDTGSADVDVKTDITGKYRPSGAGIDVGCYEAGVAAERFTVTVTNAGLGSGIVTKDPLDTTYLKDSSVVLTAIPTGSDTFGGWTGVPAGDEMKNPLTLVVDANKAITATFNGAIVITYSLTANVNPAEGGSVVLNPATGPYNQGTVVTATATPAAGYRFVNWTGDASGTAAAVQVTMNANKTITANFELIPTYTLTTNVAPVDFGTVTKVPDLPNYADGTQVQLTANPAAGKRFVNWTGDASGTNPVVTVTMNANKTVTANFEDIPAQFTLTVIINPVGAGTVVLDPTGGVYDAGTVVTLTETPNATYRFVNWTGDATGTAASAQVTMDGNKTVTANFELIPVYTLTLVADPVGAGTLAKTPNLEGYEVGAQVTLTATPAEGFQFRGWVDGSTTVTSPYTMPAENKTLTAKFKPLLPDQYTVTVVADPVAGGSVSKAPDQATYAKDAVVTLTAAENTGYTFDGWYDGATQLTTEKTYAYTVAENKVFTAKFTQVATYTLAVTADPAEKGSVALDPAGGSYEAGTVVTLTATPATDCQFDGWYDGATLLSTASPYQYTMPAENKALTAKFSDVIPGQFTVTVVADPVAGGTVSKAPDQASYANGAQVTLTAAANAAYTFDGWYDGATQVSTNASYVYTVAGANKTFTAKFTAKAQYTLTVMADPSIGGTVSKTPDQATYLEGAAVTLTATAMTGYEFVGWYDGATLLSSLTSYAYTMPAANKSLTAKFELSGLPAPANVTASGNTFRVLLNWDSVTSATAYLIERTAVDSTHTLSWTVSAADALVGTGTNAFADDTASPAIPYAYVVTALDAQENLGTPSLPATATVMAEVFAAANYKVTCKGYTLVRSASNDLTFEPTIAGSNPGTIKIALLKKMPSNAVDNAAKGIYYLTSVTQVPMLRVNGSVKTLAFDVPVLALVVRDLAKSVSAKSVTFLTANEFGSISIAATKDSGAGLYARTFIQTTSAGTTPMSIKVTGAVVEEVGSTAATAQPIKLLNVASKTYKDAAKATRTSLGAIGSLPVVVNELQVGNTTSAPAEATPCSIQGSTLKAITVSGGPLVADELVGAIDKVTVAGGNLRASLIQSSKDLVLVQATAKKGVGGAVGTAGSPLALVVKGQPSSKGVAIGKVSAQTGVSGFFYAGYDAATGAPTKSGGINILQTKSGVVEGAAFLDPALVSKLKILPKTPVQPIVINPGS